MAMNKVQFQAGLSMAEFLSRQGSEERCVAALVASRRPQGFAFYRLVKPRCAPGIERA